MTITSRRRQPTEYERAMDGIRLGIITVQIAIQDRFTPALLRAARSLEIMSYAASGEWNRYQMVGDRGRPMMYPDPAPGGRKRDTGGNTSVRSDGREAETGAI